MKKLSLFLFLFITLTQVTRAQVILSLDDDTAYIDSIARITKKFKSDSLRSINSFRLSKLYLMVQDFKKSEDYLAEANRLKVKYPFLRDASIYYNAYHFVETGDFVGFEKALVEANQKLDKYNNTEAFRLRAIIFQNYGMILQRNNNEKEYMRLLVNQAIPLAKKSKDYELISGLHKAVAIIFMNNNNRKRAAEYLNYAQDYIEKTTKKSATLAESKLETYIINAENMIELGQFANSRQLLDKAFAILKPYPNSNLNDSFFYSNGIFYAKQHKFLEALKNYEKGIASAEKHQNVIALNRLKFAEYEAYFKLKNYIKAKENLEYLLEHSLFIVDKKKYYNELAKVYDATNEHQKAYFYSNKYNVINDSLNDTKFRNEIVELEAKYKKAENEKKISLLESENKNAVLLVNNNRLNAVLFATLSFLLFLTVLFLWIWNKNQNKLSFQKELNHKQDLKALENQQKLSISNALIEGEEAERKRVARDLHDGLGSMLSGLKMHMNLAEKDKKESMQNINLLLNDTIKELRNISQNLMPESLLKLGLEHALKDLCVANSNTKNQIEFQYLIKKTNLPQHYEIMIYRIIQELLNNALKYANASNILVSCSKNKDIFFITVEDNGVGFDVAEAKNNQGMGLRNVKNRVAFLAGKLEIESAANKGTSVYIELKV